MKRDQVLYLLSRVEEGLEVRLKEGEHCCLEIGAIEGGSDIGWLNDPQAYHLAFENRSSVGKHLVDLDFGEKLLAEYEPILAI